ncbi:MAG: RIP metalloprotease RseP [Thermostichales cyanobacterium BF4_bins_65]
MLSWLATWSWTSVMPVLAAVGVLAFLILIHELGHFAAARLQGIHATRFSIGFGPALWRYQGSRTEYTLRLLPLGGYVGFPDDDPESPFLARDPDLLKNRPILDRAVVLSAGVLANLLVAYVALVLMTATVGIPVAEVQPGIRVPQVALDSPAARAGMVPGDMLLGAERGEVHLSFQDLTSRSQADQAIQAFQTLVRQGSPLQVQVQHPEQGGPTTLLLEPDTSQGVPVIGVGLEANETMVFRRPQGWGEVLREAARAYDEMVWMNVRGLQQLLTHFGDTAGQLAGPVGIVKVGADIAQTGPMKLLHFAALISINLGILNLLPLPALDGGHLAFLLIEAIRGKRLPKDFEERVMQTGLVFFLGLGVVLILKDSVAIATGAG